MTKAERTRALRYKRPALASMGYEAIIEELWEIQSACDDVQYFLDTDDGSLLNALEDGDEDEEEFRIAFADLSAKAYQLDEQINEQDRYSDDFPRDFNDCTVSLIGDRYQLVGYDTVEEDYYSLCGYDNNLAVTEAGKRLMRRTKAEMLSTIGQCLGILVAFLDLRQSYDYLKATMDILRDENTSMLQTIKMISDTYDRMTDPEATYAENRKAERDFDRILDRLPDKAWVE